MKLIQFHQINKTCPQTKHPNSVYQIQQVVYWYIGIVIIVMTYHNSFVAINHPIRDHVKLLLVDEPSMETKKYGDQELRSLVHYLSILQNKDV